MRRAALATLLLAVVVLAGCGDLLDPAAAVVDGDKITTAEVTAAFERFKKTPQYEQLASQGSGGEVARQYEQVYLSQQIRRRILRAAAEERGIEVSADEVDKRVERLRKGFQSEKDFEQAVVAQGLTLEELPEVVRDFALEEKLRAEVTEEAAPDEAEVRAFYQKHREDYARTRVQHILVKNRDRSREIARELQGASPGSVGPLFARMARQMSQDTGTARKGGDLGFTRPGQLVKPFEEAMDRLRIGEVSDPVKTPFGFHVIRVTARRVTPFNEVKDEIARRIAGDAQDKAWQRWLVEAYRKADVELSPRYGKLDLETQRIVDPSREDIPGTEPGGSAEAAD